MTKRHRKTSNRYYTYFSAFPYGYCFAFVYLLTDLSFKNAMINGYTHKKPLILGHTLYVNTGKNFAVKKTQTHANAYLFLF